MKVEFDNQHAGWRSRFDGTLADIVDHLSYRRVRLEDIKEPIYRLRYDAYRREEFVPINDQRIVEDKFDSANNTWCFGVYIRDELVSSLRIHHVSPKDTTSPSGELWPDVLSPIFEAGMSYIDPTRFTADHEASLAYPVLPFLTLRIATMASDYFDVDYCTGAVRQEHGAFYRRVFRSEHRGGDRYVNGINFPMHLYVADVRETRQQVYRRFPILQSTPEEREALFSEKSYKEPVCPSVLFALRDQMALESA